MQQQHLDNMETDPRALLGISPGVAPVASGQDSVLEPTPKEFREMMKLLRRLRRSQFLKQIPPAVPEQQSYPDAPFQMLIDTLNNPSRKRWRERTVAAWTLGQAPLNPEQTLIAARALEDALTNRQESGRKRFLKSLFRAELHSVSVVTPLLVLTLLILAATVHDGPNLGEWIFIAALAGLFGGTLLLPLVLPFYIIFDNNCANHVRTAAATALGRLRVPGSAGALIQTIFDWEDQVGIAAKSALHTVLPTLTFSYYGKMNVRFVPDLCRALEDVNRSVRPRNASEKLALKILATLEKVGDGRAVKCVERIATGGLTGHLRQEATRILPLLQVRQRQENERGMLLRGAAEPTPAAEILLRPAADQTSTSPPEHLLRPVNEEA